MNELSHIRKLCYCLLISCFTNSASAQKKRLVQYVNALQGTDSKFELSWGNTYPTTALPFGMHTWSAQTGKNGEGWKYQYSVNSIRGFQQAHQCSPWVSDYGVFSLMPETGELVVDQDKRASSFSHANKNCQTSLLKVKNSITALQRKCRPRRRGAHLRFSFPKGKKMDSSLLDGYTKQSKTNHYLLRNGRSSAM